jgi:CHRD domain
MTSSKRNLILAGVGTAASLAIAVPFVAPSDATPPAVTTTELQADLIGANEVPPADPNGVGEVHVFAADSSPDTLCWVLFVDGIGKPTMAHIHRGAAGVVGPVKVPFKAPADGDSAGCVKTTLATRILNNPSNWYVNVHNAKFPSGAIRGQLG